MTIRTTVQSCKRLLAVGALGSTMALAGCDVGTQGESGPNIQPEFAPHFNLNVMRTPQPINFAFLGTQDGTLQIANVGDPAQDGLINQLNELDGWSTTAPVSIPFYKPVDETTLEDNIKVLNVVMTSAGNATMLQGLLARAEQLTIDLVTGTPGEFEDPTYDGFFLNPDSCAFVDAAEDPVAAQDCQNDGNLVLGLDFAETAEIFGLLAAAHEIFLPGLEDGAHEPRSGHIAAVQTCGEVTDLFEMVVAQANPNQVLLKPRTALRSGDDQTCVRNTQVGLLEILYQEAGDDMVVVNVAELADDPSLGSLPPLEVPDINTLLVVLQDNLFDGSDLASLADFNEVNNGAFSDGNAEFSISFSNGYLPVVTDGVMSTEGEPAERDVSFQAVMDTQPFDDVTVIGGSSPSDQLNQLKQLYGAINQEILGAPADGAGGPSFLTEWGISLDDIVVSFAYSTQSTTTALEWVADNATSRNINQVEQLDLTALNLFLGGAENPVDPLVFGNFKLFVGRMVDVPYYLNNRPRNSELGDRGDGIDPNPTSQTASQKIAVGSWTAGGEPVTRYNLAANGGLDVDQSVDIPLVIAVPDLADCGGNVPPDGWPVALHGHGNGRTRADMITIAGRLAEACIASVAIDDVLHGTFPEATFFPLPAEAADTIVDALENEGLGALAPEFQGGNLSFRLLELLVNPTILATVLAELDSDGFLPAETPEEEQAFIDELYSRVLEDPDFVRLVTDYERHFFLDLEGDGEYTGNTGQLFFMHPDPNRLVGRDDLDAGLTGEDARLGAALTTRDQHRQSIADKIHLVRSLKDLSFTDADGNVHTFDAELRFGDDGEGNPTTRNVFWNGISQGGITGSTLLGVLGNEMRAYVPNVPVAGFMKFIEGSTAYAGELLPGLQQAGIEPGSAMAEQFFTFGQQIVDPADPLNYAITPAAQEATVLMQYVAGDAAGDDPMGDPTACRNFPPDRTVPNSVVNNTCYNIQFEDAADEAAMEGNTLLAEVLGDQQVTETAPNAGTDPLWWTMGLTEFNAPAGVLTQHGEDVTPGGPNTDQDASRAVVRFARGDHSSLLDFSAAGFSEGVEPGVSVAVTREMQSQVAEFYTSTMNGTPRVVINNHVAEWPDILVRVNPMTVPAIFTD